jgi:hypothetical protein
MQSNFIKPPTGVCEDWLDVFGDRGRFLRSAPDELLALGYRWNFNQIAMPVETLSSYMAIT